MQEESSGKALQWLAASQLFCLDRAALYTQLSEAVQKGPDDHSAMVFHKWVAANRGPVAGGNSPLHQWLRQFIKLGLNPDRFLGHLGGRYKNLRVFAKHANQLLDALRSSECDVRIAEGTAILQQVISDHAAEDLKQYMQAYSALETAHKGSVLLDQKLMDCFKVHAVHNYGRFVLRASTDLGNRFALPVYRRPEWLSERLSKLALLYKARLNTPPQAWWMDMRIGETRAKAPLLLPGRERALGFDTQASLCLKEWPEELMPQALSAHSGAQIIKCLHTQQEGYIRTTAILYVPIGAVVSLTATRYLTFDGQTVLECG